MKRPKIVRQAAKRAKRDCRDLPILRRVWVRLTPKYALELALLDGGVGTYPVQIFWHPHKPTGDEMLDLFDDLCDEMDHLMSMALRHDEIGGAS